MNDSADLEAKIDRITEGLKSLEKLVDTNDQQVKVLLGDLKGSLDGLKTLVYGSADLRYQGLVDRVGKAEDRLNLIEVSRRSERDQLRGVKYVLLLYGFSTLGQWGSIISQILK